MAPSHRGAAFVIKRLLVVLDLLSLASGLWAAVLALPGGPTLEIPGVLSSTEPFNPAIAFFLVQSALRWFRPAYRTCLQRAAFGVRTAFGSPRRFGLTTLAIAAGAALTLAYVIGAIETYGRPTIAGDALGHYAWLRSLAIDRDLDFSNEFRDYREQYALPDPDEKTASGLVSNPWPVGPALLWAPAFAVAHATADPERGHARDGYSRPYQRAVVFASVAYGLLGFLLTYLCARRVARAWPAFAATSSLFWCTPALFYVTGDPAMAHGLSIFSVGLFVLLWLRWFHSTTSAHYLLLGAAGGLCALVRFQDGAILLLPALSLLARRDAWRGRLRLAAWLGAGLAAALLPQILAWRQLYGRWLLIPQGGGFLRWSEPAIADLLFSWHHGFVSWTPLAGLLLLTALVFACRRPALGAPLLAFVAVEIWLAAAASDWWGGAAFGARRLVSLSTPLAIGFAGVLAGGGSRIRAALLVVCVVAGFANVVFVESYRWGHIDDVAPVNLLAEAPRVLEARLGESGGVAYGRVGVSATDAKRVLLLLCAACFCLAWRRAESMAREPEDRPPPAT